MSITEQEAISAFDGKRMILRRDSGNRPICPVCGVIYDQPAAEAAWVETGEETEEGLPLVLPSWSFCPRCKTQFGNDDDPGADGTIESAWTILRLRWLSTLDDQSVALERIEENLGISS